MFREHGSDTRWPTVGIQRTHEWCSNAYKACGLSMRHALEGLWLIGQSSPGGKPRPSEIFWPADTTYPYRTHRLSWTIKHMPAMGYKTPGPTGCPMTHRWTAHWIANVECHRTLHGICKGIARGLQIVTWHLMPHPISHGPSIDMWNTASQYISFPLHHRRVGPREITRSRIRIVMGDAVGSV